MPEHLNPEDVSGDRPEPAPQHEPVGYYAGANNARWVVFGFVALIAAFVIYMALGMPGMSHDGDGGMDHDMDDMDEMLP